MKKFFALFMVFCSTGFADTITKIDDNTVSVQRTTTEQATVDGYNAEIYRVEAEKDNVQAHIDSLTERINTANARKAALNERLATVRAEKAAAIAAGCNPLGELAKITAEKTTEIAQGYAGE